MTLSTFDPRVKLAVLLGISSVSIISRSPLTLFVLLVFTLLILLLGGVKLFEAVYKIRGALGLILSLFILQVIFNRGGTPLLSVFGVAIIKTGGLSAALLVCLRLLIILMTALILLTSESRDYLLAFTQMRLPYEIAFMVLIALRFIPMLREEAQDVLCAVQMRGVKLKRTGLRNKASVYISVLIPIVAGAIRRSEQMAVAMEARAFRSAPKRTNMRRLKFRLRDLIYLFVFCVLLMSIVIFV